MRELESKETAKQQQKQTGQGLKILTPSQIRSRLPISLAQLKAGNNSQKIENKTMKLLRNTKKDGDQYKYGVDATKLESAEVVLVHCNLVNNNYQQASKVLFTFVPNKQFEQLINILPYSLTILSITNTEFSSIEVWFTD